ncbi:MAG: ABC transporter substrate-binding protein [Treponema sp.]|jgi:NitT/TauT family transport system substrate-binding protein|nr:ABC transporter substrate-binding protein [Treponema sp.]
MKKKNWAFVVTVLLVTLALTGCRSKKVKGGDYVLRVGIQSDLCLAPLHIAIEKGFFEAEGLKFEAIKIESAVAAEAIAGNQIDAGFGLLAKFIQPLENGLPLKFTSGIHTGCIKIVVPRDSGAQSLSDLRGKNVGVPGLMASPALIAKRALAAAGIGVTGDNLEVNFMAYSNADLYIALEKGAIDAVAGGDPGVSVAEREYNLKVLLDTASGELYKNEYCCLSFVTTNLAEKHPEIAAQFTRAVLKASEWVEKNPVEAAKIQIEKNYIAGDVDFNASLLASYSYKPSVQGGYDALKNTINEFKAIKLLNDETNTARLLETSFVFLDGVN